MCLWHRDEPLFSSLYRPKILPLFRTLNLKLPPMEEKRLSNSNQTNLILKIKNGNLDELKEDVELLEVDVNTQLNDRYALHYAADYGQVDVLKYLIQQGADVNARDAYGVTPLLTSIWEGHPECVKVLLDNGATMDLLTPDGKTYSEVAEHDEIKELLGNKRYSTDSTKTNEDEEKVDN